MSFSASQNGQVVNGWTPVSLAVSLLVQNEGMYDEDIHKIAILGYENEMGANVGWQHNGVASGDWEKVCDGETFDAAKYALYALEGATYGLSATATPIVDNPAFSVAVSGNLKAKFISNNAGTRTVKLALNEAGANEITHTIGAVDWALYCSNAGDFDPVKFILWVFRKLRNINKLPTL